MPRLQDVRINTAGAYVCIDDRYLFAIGIRPHDGHIPVVRLGGHREEHETGWQCAVREVYEEANLPIQPLVPQTTYVWDWNHLETKPQEIDWQPTIEHEPIPLLVVAYHREETMHLSLMYLARAEDVPQPSSEVKGIVLLTEEEIHRLCQEPVTLAEYLGWGGQAILNDHFNTRLLLEPFAQLRLLSRILGMQSKTKAI